MALTSLSGTSRHHYSPRRKTCTPASLPSDIDDYKSNVLRSIVLLLVLLARNLAACNLYPFTRLLAPTWSRNMCVNVKTWWFGR